MSFQKPLSAQQLTLLRSGGYAAEQVVNFLDMRVVLSGSIDTDLTGHVSWAEFNYTLDSGDYTKVLTDQYMVISLDNNIKHGTLFGRTREAATNTRIRCNEFSVDIPIGSYFWVLDLWTPQYRLSRPSSLDPNTAVELVDYNVAFERLAPAILGLRTAYQGWAGSNGSTGKLRLGFDVSRTFAAEYGETITDFEWLFRAGYYTVVAGDLDEAILIVDFEPGQLYGHCRATDSNTISKQRHFAVVVNDADNLPAGVFDEVAISNSLEQGWTATVPAALDVDEILPNTLGIVSLYDEHIDGERDSLWNSSWVIINNKVLTSNVATLQTDQDHTLKVGQEIIIADVDSIFNGTYQITAITINSFSYAKVHANVGSAFATGMAIVNPNNIQFVGWLQSADDVAQGDERYNVLTKSTFVFNGVSGRLGRTGKQLIPLVNKAVPTVWGEINKLTPFRGAQHYADRYTTLTTLCDIEYEAFNEVYETLGMGSQGSNALDILNGLAKQARCTVEFAPDGRIQIMREFQYLTQAERNNLPEIASFDIRDLIIPGGISRTIDPNPSIGSVAGNGGYYNTSNGQVTVLTCLAPGLAQADASGSDTLSDQVLKATADKQAAIMEITGYTGALFEYLNTNEFMDIDHPASYASICFIASHRQFYAWELDTELGGPNNINRILYDTDTKWVIDSWQLGYNKEFGFPTCKVRYRKVCGAGSPGDDTTQDIPAPGEIPLEFPDYGEPAFVFEDPAIYADDTGFDEVSPADLLPPEGRIVEGNGTELITWSEITNQVFFERKVTRLRRPLSNEITPPDLGAFVVTQALVDPSSDLVTRVGAYVLANNGTNSAVWYTDNAAITVPEWTKGTEFPGVYTIIRGTKDTGSVEVYTPTSIGSPILKDTFSIDSAVNAIQNGLFVTDISKIYLMTIDGDVQISFVVQPNRKADTYYITLDNWATHSQESKILIEDGITFFLPDNTAYNSLHSYTMTRAGTGAVFGGKFDDTVYTDNLGVFTVTVYELSGSPTSATRLITDYGQSTGGVFVVGISPGSIGGYDTQKVGEVCYASADGGIYKSSSLVGPYTLWFTIPGGASAVCLIIPYRRRNSSTSNTAVSDPDVVAACDDGKWYWIDGTAATATDITPVASLIPEKANCTTTRYGKNIAVFGNLGGTRKIYESINGGTSWTFVQNTTNPGFIRCRRNDITAAGSPAKGQLYAADGGLLFSSKWGSNGLATKLQPVSITGLDTVF